jgi:hypothetical protein
MSTSEREQLPRGGAHERVGIAGAPQVEVLGKAGSVRVANMRAALWRFASIDRRCSGERSHGAPIEPRLELGDDLRRFRQLAADRIDPAPGLDSHRCEQ